MIYACEDWKYHADVKFTLASEFQFTTSTCPLFRQNIWLTIFFFSLLQINVVLSVKRKWNTPIYWQLVFYKCWTRFLHLKLISSIHHLKRQYLLNWIINTAYDFKFQSQNRIKILLNFILLSLRMCLVLSPYRLVHVIRTDWPNTNSANNSLQMEYTWRNLNLIQESAVAKHRAVY